MTFDGCELFGPQLGPFLDGELDGARMLDVSRHLEHCDECAAALADLRDVGGALRDGGAPEAPGTTFDGLAGTIVTRFRVEAAVSWRATLLRGLDDWHWAIVGGSTVAATFVSTSLLSVMLALGPQRDDSLSAMLTNMGEPAGFFFVFASPVGGADEDVRMLQVDNGRPAAPRIVSDLVVSREHEPATEAELVARLREVITRQGRVVEIDSLRLEQRAVAEALLDELSRLRSRRTEPNVRSYQVHEVRLVTSVRAKSS